MPSSANVALKYAREVIKGKIPSGEYVVLACERFLKDVKRKDIDFLPRKAERFIHFVEQLPHVKGSKFAGKPLLLQPWQKFIFVNLFGFYHKDGTRRFQEAFILVPRKNGKSIMVTALGLFMLILDGEVGAEVLCGATSEKQANYVFRPAKLMLQKCPELVSDFGLEVFAESITKPEDDSSFQRIIGDPGDGGSPSCGIVDEFHEHKNADLYNTMKTGMGARTNPLLVVITTAGNNIAGPCYDLMEENQKILKGIFDDDASDEVFAMMWGIDEGDDWTAPATLAKANPNIGISVSEKWLLKQQVQAVRSKKDQGPFKTKHLNIWVNATESFLNFEEWKRCADPDMKQEDFSEWQCMMGVDLSSRIDITADAKVFFKMDDDGAMQYRVFADFWLPKERVTEEGAPRYYQQWVDEGLLQVCEGDEIEVAQVVQAIVDDCEDFYIEEIAFDPWKSAGYEQQLEVTGVPISRFPQTVGQYTAPMWELEAAVKSGRLKHNNNKVLNWMCSNLEVKRDTNGNVKPRKENSAKKIDGFTALIMAIGRAMAQGETNVDLSDSYTIG